VPNQVDVSHAVDNNAPSRSLIPRPRGVHRHALPVATIGPTELAVLVGAADERRSPQTLEAISPPRAAEVPIVVANQQDRQGRSQPEVVKQELLAHQQLVAEELGAATRVMVAGERDSKRENIRQLLR